MHSLDPSSHALVRRVSHVVHIAGAQESTDDPNIPDGAVQSLRTAIQMGFAQDPSSTFKYEGETYWVGDVMPRLRAEDALADAAAAAAAGSSAAAGTMEACGTRKTKNCLPRLMLCIIQDQFKTNFMLHQQGATRRELDEGAVGPRAEIWSSLRAAFVDPSFQVCITLFGFVFQSHP